MGNFVTPLHFSPPGKQTITVRAAGLRPAARGWHEPKYGDRDHPGQPNPDLIH